MALIFFLIIQLYEISMHKYIIVYGLEKWLNRMLFQRTQVCTPNPNRLLTTTL